MYLARDLTLDRHVAIKVLREFVDVPRLHAPQRLEGAVERCLAKAPRERFPTAEHLVAALKPRGAGRVARRTATGT